MFHFVAKHDGKIIVGIKLATQTAAEQLRERYEKFGYHVEVTDE